MTPIPTYTLLKIYHIYGLSLYLIGICNARHIIGADRKHQHTNTANQNTFFLQNQVTLEEGCTDLD